MNDLFSNGTSLFSFPIKLIYLPIKEDAGSDVSFSFAVTVPKRLHKKAYTRNLLKRRIREAYRQNKINSEGQIIGHTRYALMYLLVDKEVSEYALIERAIKKLHRKFLNKVTKKDD